MSKQPKSEKAKEVEKVKSEVVSYPAFFQEVLGKGLVKSWQEREIYAFFKDIGLQDKEPTDKYKIALAKF
jgi:hypothetical protein